MKKVLEKEVVAQETETFSSSMNMPSSYKVLLLTFYIIDVCILWVGPSLPFSLIALLFVIKLGQSFLNLRGKERSFLSSLGNNLDIIYDGKGRFLTLYTVKPSSSSSYSELVSQATRMRDGNFEMHVREHYGREFFLPKRLLGLNIVFVASLLLFLLGSKAKPSDIEVLIEQVEFSTLTNKEEVIKTLKQLDNTLKKGCSRRELSTKIEKALSAVAIKPESKNREEQNKIESQSVRQRESNEGKDKDEARQREQTSPNDEGRENDQGSGEIDYKDQDNQRGLSQNSEKTKEQKSPEDAQKSTTTGDQRREKKDNSAEKGSSADQNPSQDESSGRGDSHGEKKSSADGEKKSDKGNAQEEESQGSAAEKSEEKGGGKSNAKQNSPGSQSLNNQSGQEQGSQEDANNQEFGRSGGAGEQDESGNSSKDQKLREELKQRLEQLKAEQANSGERGSSNAGQPGEESSDEQKSQPPSASQEGQKSGLPQDKASGNVPMPDAGNAEQKGDSKADGGGQNSGNTGGSGSGEGPSEGGITTQKMEVLTHDETISNVFDTEEFDSDEGRDEVDFNYNDERIDIEEKDIPLEYRDLLN